MKVKPNVKEGRAKVGYIGYWNIIYQEKECHALDQDGSRKDGVHVKNIKGAQTRLQDKASSKDRHPEVEASPQGCQWDVEVMGMIIERWKEQCHEKSQMPC